jgi:hypothetical protein
MTRTAALTILAATTLALAGCAGAGAKLTYSDTETAKITEIALDGHSGDVIVRTAAVTETTVKRIVSSGSDPKLSYRVDGGTLHLDTECGHNCSVAYDIQAPPGVAVKGALTSGDIQLTDVGSADVAVTSGDVVVHGASGLVRVRANSGDVVVDAAKAGVDLQVNSGDVRASDVSGGPVTVKVNSGGLTLRVGAATPVTAQTSSGDLHLTVPSGHYQVRTQKGSGDLALHGVTNDPSATTALDLKVGSGDLTVDTV